MLLTVQQMIFVQVFHDVASQDVLHLFTQNAGQRNGTVVDGIELFALLKDWCYVSFLPSIWGLCLF